MSDTNKLELSRRSFVKQGTAGLAATAAAANLGLLTNNAYAQSGDKVMGLGIVGCGGRGNGAMGNCLRAAEELGIKVKLVAVADVAADRAERAKKAIETAWGPKGGYGVTDETTFVGMDAYKSLCAHPDVDIVIQTTPPGLRYLTLREAVKNGKHSFVEKPVCVDSDTYRHVIESGEIAKQNGLAIVTGTQYRREALYVDAIDQLQNGVIGDITASYQYYCAGTQWHLGNGNGEWDDMTYQMRNWPYFPWLSGDLIAEQSIHNIDAINWSMGGPPKKAYASGGRISRIKPEYGTIYDHFSVHFEWDNGVRSAFMGRHYRGSTNKVQNKWIGTKGTLDLSPGTSGSRWIARGFDGKVLARNEDKRRDSYVEEHVALLDGITSNSPVMEIQEVADSSLTCILGRESAYSGKELEFKFLAEQAKLKLRPEGIDNGPKPGPVNLPFPNVLRPGIPCVPDDKGELAVYTVK
ncbi:MAG: Gfo/Idh/MocA family oxidoreductase [Planctomycetota bacterium]